MNWRVAKSLDVLLGQLNQIAPNRSKVSDGSIGDVSHSARASDHNPDAAGVVHARDFTNDPVGGLDGNLLAKALEHGKDIRIKYVIWNRHIMSGAAQDHQAWVWRPYTGTNPHNHHVHVSVKGGQLSDSTTPWLLDALKDAIANPPVALVSAMTPVPALLPLLKKGMAGDQVNDLQLWLNAHGATPKLSVNSAFDDATELAVKAFQRSQNILDDGKVGPYTREKMVGAPTTLPPVQVSTPAPFSVPDKAVKLFQGMGWEKHQAVAIVAHGMWESAGNSKGTILTDAIGDRGTAFGGWQWRNERIANEKALASRRRVPWIDLETQCVFVDQELRTSERRAGGLLHAAKDVESAVAAMMGYLRPVGFSWDNPRAGHGFTQRLGIANHLMTTII